MHPLLAVIPIIGLVAAMTVRSPMLRLPLPAHVALPIAAVVALVIQLLGGVDVGGTILPARVVEGLLTALMPLSIVFGAIVLFRTLRASGALAATTSWLERSTPDAVMRVMLIAWSFSYLVEGLSGFGTPAALAAPLLVGMGFRPVRAAAACLVMNTVPVVFGAVGTPVWFGLGDLGLSADAFRSLRIEAAFVQCVIAPVVVVSALRLLFSWSDIRAHALSLAAVVLITVATSAAVATVSSEFPSIVGGIAGLIAAFGIGRLSARNRVPPDRHANRATRTLPVWRAMFPLLATVLLLAATRLEPLGLKPLLNAETPRVSFDAGGLGEFSVSAALVTRADAILGTDISWSMPVLYVPFIIPFLVVSLLSAPVIGLSARRSAMVWIGAARGLVMPAVALAGALVFVKLMVHGGETAPVVTIGRSLADGVGAIYGPLWLAGAPLVGALGSFFSGSATVSNLTFGAVQLEIARSLGLEPSRVLALQAIGAAIGNMACIHNIVAVAAVLGLTGTTATHENRHDQTKDERVAQPRDPVANILHMNALPLFFAAVAAICAAALVSLIDIAAFFSHGT